MDDSQQQNDSVAPDHYVRWQKNQPRAVTSMLADDDHSSIGHPCGVCNLPILAGDVITMWAIGPEDVEDVQAHEAGRWYSARATVLHQQCVPELESAPIPDNGFKVGHRGACAMFMIMWSSGEKYQIMLDLRNENVIDYLFDPMNRFMARHPEASQKFVLTDVWGGPLSEDGLTVDQVAARTPEQPE